jgi:hypothetical protein
LQGGGEDARLSRVTVGRTVAAVLLVLGLVACEDDPERPATPSTTLIPATEMNGLPPTARRDLIAMLREDTALERHVSDGGGSVQLVSGPEQAVAGQPGRWSFRYTAGPHGIAIGGMLFFQPPPFWSWSPPQVADIAQAGFTAVATEAPGMTLDAGAVADGLLAVTIGGRALAPGEQITLTYGAGPRGALADRYAERGSAFWFGVDGNGDGVRRLIADPPRITIIPGQAARLVAHWPSVARPGERVALTVAALDIAGNTGVRLDEPVRLDGDAAVAHPASVRLDAQGRGTVLVDAPASGIHRLRASTPSGLAGETNPLEISASAPRILWGDLHGHSNYSDGTGLPEDYFRYARDVSALDVVALSDHDHWGLEFLDMHPSLWSELGETTRRFHEPGRFVTLLAFEWTSWAWGHRHVLYFGDEGPLVSSLDPLTDHPRELWAALERHTALTVAHHPAGGPIAIDWDIPPDPRFEPVTEVSSVHGSSEAADTPLRIYNAVAGHYVRDALDRGYQLGFVGSGDTHDGHPGLGHLMTGMGGLAAILSEERTRQGVLAAMRARHTYATSGPRIILRFSVDTTPMGGTLPADTGDAPHAIAVRAIGTAPIARIDLVRSGTVVATAEGDGEPEASWTTQTTHLASGEYVYVRVVQGDGALAWSSPVFAADDAPAGPTRSSTNTRTSRPSERR